MVLSEFWHDRGGRRRINSGDSMAYEYAIGGCILEFELTAVRSQAAALVHLKMLFFMALKALRETTADLTEFTPGRCHYD